MAYTYSARKNSTDTTPTPRPATTWNNFSASRIYVVVKEYDGEHGGFLSYSTAVSGAKRNRDGSAPAIWLRVVPAKDLQITESGWYLASGWLTCWTKANGDLQPVVYLKEVEKA